MCWVPEARDFCIERINMRIELKPETTIKEIIDDPYADVLRDITDPLCECSVRKCVSVTDGKEYFVFDAEALRQLAFEGSENGMMVFLRILCSVDENHTIPIQCLKDIQGWRTDVFISGLIDAANNHLIISDDGPIHPIICISDGEKHEREA